MSDMLLEVHPNGRPTVLAGVQWDHIWCRRDGVNAVLLTDSDHLWVGMEFYQVVPDTTGRFLYGIRPDQIRG